ncbi:MAG: hypothetical protein ACI9DC_003954 [Gammaproteobacteria bacterium]|jgi:hypothetical protein
MSLHIDIAPSTRPWQSYLPWLQMVTIATLLFASIVQAAAQNPSGNVKAIADDTNPYAKFEHWTALQIMVEAQRRHEQFPFVYEEQTMVLMDAQGNRSVRLCRRFSRTEDDGSAKFLLVFDDPEEIRGVALLAVRDDHGKTTRGVYLPAFGSEFKEPAPGTRSEHFLGTDFSVEDLTTESLDEYRYVRTRDRIREGVEFFILDAYPANAQIERSTGYGLRRHHIRKDNFMIVQTGFFDRHLRFMKQISHHDLHPVSGDSWRANMIVVSTADEQHRTLLKIDRRIYSSDYVPDEIFEPAFLLENRHVLALDDRVSGRLGQPLFATPGQVVKKTDARRQDSRRVQNQNEKHVTLGNRARVGSENKKERQ